MSGCRDWGKCVYGISSIRSRRYYFFTLREATVTIRGRASIRGWCQLTLTVKPHCLLSHQNDNCFVRELAIAN